MQVFTFSPHLIHLFVATFLTLFLKVFNLQGKYEQVYHYRSLDSSACLAASVSARQPSIRGSIPDTRNICLFHNVHISYPGSLGTGRSYLSTAEVKDGWSCTSTPPTCHGVVSRGTDMICYRLYHDSKVLTQDGIRRKGSDVG
jgi:hypothetical protein